MVSPHISASMMTSMLIVYPVARHSAIFHGLHGLRIALIASVSVKQVRFLVRLCFNIFKGNGHKSGPVPTSLEILSTTASARLPRRPLFPFGQFMM